MLLLSVKREIVLIDLLLDSIMYLTNAKSRKSEPSSMDPSCLTFGSGSQLDSVRRCPNLASFPGFSFSYYVCWNMKNKLQKHGEKENTYTHA